MTKPETPTAERGSADSPSPRLPLGGREVVAAGRWARDFVADLWTAAKRFWLQNAFNECAAVSYYALLSIVPFVALVTAAAGFVFGTSEDAVEIAVERIRILVPQFGPQLTAGIRELVQYRASIGAVSLLVTLWTSSWVFSSLQSAMDRIFGGHRPLWGALKPRVIALGAPSLLILSFYANTLLSVAADLNLPVADGIVARIRALPLTDLVSSLLLDGFILAVILFALPPRVYSWRIVVPSALVGSLLWQGAKDLFSLYVNSSAWHASFRGSAAAALVFMLWIYYLAAVVLYCAELVGALDERRRARDE